MNEQQLQQAFIQFLAQKTGAKTQQELEAAIQQMGEEGLRQAYAEFMQLIQQQQVQAAKFGAKLNYIKSLRGQCPEGYEISYHKVGGTLCKKCIKKKQQMEDGGKAPKDAIDEFKQNKTKKKAQGGGVNLNNGKCNKKENGGEINSTRNPKSFDKMTLAKCGAKLKEACKGIKINKNGKKLEKKEDGGKTKDKKKKYPLNEEGGVKYYDDLATRDSIAANRYNDQEIMTQRPGNIKKNKDGKPQWVPDRTKSPYNKKQ